MLGTTEKTGFEALCRSKESPTAALAGVAAVGLTALAYHKASQSRAEVDEYGQDVLSQRGRKRFKMESSPELSLEEYESMCEQVAELTDTISPSARRNFIKEARDIGLTAEDLKAIKDIVHPYNRYFLAANDLAEQGASGARVLYWYLNAGKDPSFLEKEIGDQLPHPREPDAEKRVHLLHDIMEKSLSAATVHEHYIHGHPLTDGECIRAQLRDLRQRAGKLSFAQARAQGLDLEFLDAPHIGYLSLSDLQKIAALPSYAIASGQIKMMPGCQKVDWKRTNKNVAQMNALPVDMLRTLGVGVHDWVKWSTANEPAKKIAREAYNLSDQVRFGPARDRIKQAGAMVVSHDMPEILKEEEDFIKATKSLSSDGRLKVLDDIASKTYSGFDDYNMRWMIFAIDHMGLSRKNLLDLGSLAKIQEDLESKYWESSGGSDRYVPEMSQVEARAADRFAQKNPEWAIREYSHEYRRGEKLAPALNVIVDYIDGLLKQGKPVVIHGRDGELIYRMLERRPGVDMSKLRYAITSRSLTTKREGEMSEEYKAYLKRMIPPNAVHIDTGFKGSVPRWIHENVAPVADIKMVSAENPEEEIPIPKEYIPSYGRQEMVLQDLEHSAQRLAKPREWAKGERRYSAEAPGFWARLYGALSKKSGSLAEFVRALWAA